MSVDKATIEEVRHQHPLEDYLPKRGVELKRAGKELVGLCPLHKEKTPSFNVNVEKQAWNCRGGCGGGDLFLLVQKLDGITFTEAVEKLAGRPLRDARSAGEGVRQEATTRPEKVVRAATPAPSKQKTSLPPPSVIYDYVDAEGKLVQQALRYQLEGRKKTFRQRRPDGRGGWLWELGEIETPVYRLPEVLAASAVWIVEGEKDVETLAEFGITATCNPMGAGKWYEHHSRMLAGKEVIICGDNDETGQKHVEDVEKSLAPHAKFTKRIRVPESCKDLTEFVAQAKTREAGMLVLMELAMAAPEMYRGIELPFQSMTELEAEYATTVSREKTASVDLANWLPSFRWMVRPLVPGELLTFLAATGAGKTAILQNIAVAIAPLPVLLFELELPGSLTFERFAALATSQSGADVYRSYQEDDPSARPKWQAVQKLQSIYTCSRSNLTVAQMTRFVNFAHLKLGRRPAVVMVDYFGLVSADGRSRYERMSAAAEELKTMAKATGTVVIATSQVDREASTREGAEIYLNDAKDSGSIENSSGVVIGAWRDPEDLANERMFLKVLKNTKGKAGRKIACRCDHTLRIVELGLTQS